jgi:hypothetical protein
MKPFLSSIAVATLRKKVKIRARQDKFAAIRKNLNHFSIKNLAIHKKTISTLVTVNQLKGGRTGTGTSHTSCLCMDTVCECEMKAPY